MYEGPVYLLVQIFIARHPKNPTVLQLFSQGNDIKIEETNLTLEPAHVGTDS